MKKLSVKDAISQAKRLQACPLLAPQSDEGKREVVDCLMRNCRSVEHAERTLTTFLDGCRECRNLTAELAAVARRVRTVEITDDEDRAQIWDHESGRWVVLEEKSIERIMGGCQ